MAGLEDLYLNFWRKIVHSLGDDEHVSALGRIDDRCRCRPLSAAQKLASPSVSLYYESSSTSVAFSA